MSVRFMIDTDDLSLLTGHVELLATYGDLVTDLAQLQHEFPNSTIILINRGLGDPTGKTSVADIEPGAMTIAQALAWYDEQRSKGIEFLTTYHDRNDAPAVASAFAGRPHFNWDATLDGTAHIAGYHPLEGPAAVQCLSATMLGYHADGSLVFRDDWHPTRQSVNTGTLKTDVNAALSRASELTSDLHRMAALLGG